MNKLRKYVILGVTTLCLFSMTGCGVSHKSPEGVVKSLIESYAKGKEKRVKDCYNAKKKTDKNLQKQIDATIKYFEAHNPKEVEIQECDVLSEEKNNAYVYVIYHMVLENKQEYPCISTYITKKEDKKYYVLPPAEITEEMSKAAATEYAKFMTTEAYKNYTKDYETFIKKNPGYEEKIAGKLS